MKVKWNCPKCLKDSWVGVDLEAKIGLILTCPNCAAKNVTDFQVTVTTTSKLVIESKDVQKAKELRKFIETREDAIREDEKLGI